MGKYWKKDGVESLGQKAQSQKPALVFLARNAWHLGKIKEDFPRLVLSTTREQTF